MPTYIASGGHYFGSSRCRFLILPRYEFDLHSIIKNRVVDTKNILIIADQLIGILEHIHDNGYAHSDIKAENIMIGKCTYKKDTANDSTKIIETINGHGKRNQSKSRSRSSSDYDEDDEGSEFELDDDEFDDDEEDVDDIDDDENISSDENATSGDNETDESSDSALYDSGGYHRKKKNRLTITTTSTINNNTNVYTEEMSTSHYSRRAVKRVNYCENEDEEKIENDDDDDWERKNSYVKRNYGKYSSQLSSDSSSSNLKKNAHGTKMKSTHQQQLNRPNEQRRLRDEIVTEDRVHLIDFGLALKFVDCNGIHRPFVMDQRRAHDGTLEFTSRDAHMGAHSRRSDLECLAYNLIYWKEGYLPWKNDKMMNQPEQVHRMKEFFMTDIKQFYKKIYNVPIPTFIYDFLTHVSNLAYHDRPDYKLCKNIFVKEFIRLGYKKHEMILNIDSLKNAPSRKLDTDEIDGQHVINQRVNDVQKMMKMGMIIPFCETPTQQNQISPKNLRSKSTQNPKKRRKKFSWTEILSTDPDQIARQRAEKEFEREDCDPMPARRYDGNPTYAILEIERSKSKNKLDIKDTNDAFDQTIKGYTKPMMNVWRKRQLNLLEQFQIDNVDNNKIIDKLNETELNVSKNHSNETGNNNHSTTTTTNGKLTTKKRRKKQESTTSSEKSYSSDDVCGNGGNYVNGNSIKTVLTTNGTTKSRNRKKHQQISSSSSTTTIDKCQKIPIGKQTPKRKRKLDATANKRNGTKQVQSTTPTNNQYLTIDDNSNRSYNDSSESMQSVTDANQNTTRKYNSSCGMSSPASEDDSRESMHSGRGKSRLGRTRVNLSMKTLAMSDEDSRDTTDYSPVKTRHRRTKDGRASKKAKRVIGRGTFL